MTEPHTTCPCCTGYGGHAMTLTNADLAAIRERYKQCVHESDYADLAEHTPALLDTIDELREVLAEMATTPPLGSSVHREWDKRIARARAFLQRMEGGE